MFTIIFLILFKNSACDYLYPALPGIQTTSLPEIIINKAQLPAPGPSSGYYYPVPQPPNEVLPPLQDEIPITPIDNGYLPPSNDYLPPGQNDFQPFQPVPHPVYGVPQSILQKQNGFDPTNTEPFIRVISMSCLDSTDSRFFKAIIQSSDFINTPPVFIKTTFGCNILKKNNDAFALNLEGINVGNCGVRYCNNKKMCLNLRLPTVQGLQLPEDRLVTLQCSPQHSIASVVRSIGIKTQKIQPRTLGFNTIASGGLQRPFRPHLALYRKNSQVVEPGTSVVLGEELLLKATINENEDWKFAKMGLVVMQQGVQTGLEPRKSITLIDKEGCRVDSMKSVCPNHPEQLSNKVIVIPIRAFLFQDVDGDEMLLSVRLYGCMHQKDCQQSKHCEEKATTTLNTSNTLSASDAGRNLSLGRRKRSMVNGFNSTQKHESRYYSPNVTSASKMARVKNNDSYSRQSPDSIETIESSVQDYESHLDFRVVLPQSSHTIDTNQLKSMKHMHDYNVYSNWTMDDIYNGYLFISLVLIVGITCIVVLCVVVNITNKSKLTNYPRDY